MLVLVLAPTLKKAKGQSRVTLSLRTSTSKSRAASHGQEERGLRSAVRADSAAGINHEEVEDMMVSYLPCNVRREGG